VIDLTWGSAISEILEKSVGHTIFFTSMMNPLWFSEIGRETRGGRSVGEMENEAWAVVRVEWVARAMQKTQ
jgi:hypothetical protein